MNKSEELIACLEGEIAKRDEELAACRVAVENCEVFRARIAEIERELGNSRVSLKDSDAGLLSFMDQCNQLRAELAAIKAQEPVAWVGAIEDGVPLLVAEPENWKATPLYAAPVSEAKAQGVVMPERASAIHGSHDHQSGWNACLDEVARLNAAPIQQVSVPDERIIPTSAELVQWAWEEEPEETRFQEGYNAAKRWVKMQIEAGIAAPAAPAADAGLVGALENVLKSGRGSSGRIILDEEDEADARAALAAHRSKGVV